MDNRAPGAALLVALLAGAVGCGTVLGKRAPGPVAALNTMAVLPVEREEPRSETGQRGEAEELPPDAEKVITAQIYGVLVAGSRWRLVPDLSVDAALRSIPSTAGLEARARALGSATNADVVLFGAVSRFREREGGELGVRRPAAVGLTLNALVPASGEVVWRGAFNEEQQPLSSNLLNWWMFWRQGPRWFSAAELARLAVEKLIGDLDAR